MIPMAEAVKTVSNPKSFAFEMPKFEIPSFEMPKMEVPAAFREVAEKSVAQAKETWDKMKAASEEATEIMEETYTTASKGASDYGLKVIDTTRANVNAAFDFASALMGAKSISEIIELSTSHARSSFDTMSAQTKELAALAQKVATDAVEPMKTGMTSAFKKVS
ncbi:MAG: phasin [Pseudorhodoplanes sp.]|nr:phasin [Pseudorhodoplanes sp.]